jgi:hypothetical protein
MVKIGKKEQRRQIVRRVLKAMGYDKPTYADFRLWDPLIDWRATAKLMDQSPTTRTALCHTLDEETQAKVNDAAAWIKAKLANGVRLSSTLIKEGEEDGFSRDMLLMAKNKLGVQVQGAGFGTKNKHFWELPAEEDGPGRERSIRGSGAKS